MLYDAYSSVNVRLRLQCYLLVYTSVKTKSSDNWRWYVYIFWLENKWSNYIWTLSLLLINHWNYFYLLPFVFSSSRSYFSKSSIINICSFEGRLACFSRIVIYFDKRNEKVSALIIDITYFDSQLSKYHIKFNCEYVA